MIDRFRGLIEENDKSYWVYFSFDDLKINKKLIKLLNEFSTITQSIGKKDSEGNELYEGDVLLVEGKTYQQKWLIEPIGEREDDSESFGMVASPKGNGINAFIDNSLLKGKKIGDIYIDGDLILR
jgi:hypothetical protein